VGRNRKARLSVLNSGLGFQGWALTRSGSVQLLGQLHAAHALVVTLDGGGFLALALGGRLLVELAGAQVGQQAQFFDGALEAAQSNVERLVFFNADGGQ